MSDAHKSFRGNILNPDLRAQIADARRAADPDATIVDPFNRGELIQAQLRRAAAINTPSPRPFWPNWLIRLFRLRR